jgi:HSP20 family molecular chaperone IbpA
MRDEFDRFIEQMTREFGESNDGQWRWGIEVEDNDDTVIVRAEAPGFDTEDLDVRVVTSDKSDKKENDIIVAVYCTITLP